MIEETKINVISAGSVIQGELSLELMSRIHGNIKGTVRATDGSQIILTESGLIEGNVFGDSVWIDGTVRGDVFAKTRVVITENGRVIGNIKTPSLKIHFGALFEGQCLMDRAVESISETVSLQT